MTQPQERSGVKEGRLWGLQAQTWAEVQESLALVGYEAVFDRLSLTGARYLDAGCGAGMAAKLAADRGAVVHGLDASENLLNVARGRVPKGEFRVGELEELPYADASFDVVTGFNSFQFATRPPVAFGEARRVTKPGGSVAILTKRLTFPSLEGRACGLQSIEQGASPCNTPTRTNRTHITARVLMPLRHRSLSIASR